MNYSIFLLSLSIPSVVFLFIGGKWLFYKLIQKKGIAHLGKIYFMEDPKLKNEILTKLKEITKNQYSDLELTDYFLKIKGLQNFNKDRNTSFWINRYLKQKAAIKLDYFEQCDFFKAFKDIPSNTKSARIEKRKSTKVRRLPKTAQTIS